MCGKYGALWPQVTGTCNIAKSVNLISTNMIRFDYPDDNEPVREFLDQATFLFLKSLNEECGRTCNMPSENSLFVKITVTDSSLGLNAATDESYHLNISTATGNQMNAQIISQTVFGARHALESLSQLVVKTVDDNERVGLLIVSSAELTDKPFYQHRGLLVDTARHFIPTTTLLKILDGMSANKMNVFHWHITDSQSFPMETKRLPQMHTYGAFSREKVYHKNEIDEVVKYAKYRGIRVIFELDAPAHAGHGWEWGEQYGLGKLAVCVDDQPWRKSCIQPNCGQLNPANENLYSVLRDVYQDIRDYKEKGEYFHMGGDEVFIQCWNNTKEITDYMAEKNYNRDIGGFLQLWSEFQAKALNVYDNITSEKEPIVLWSSEMTLPDNIEQFLPADRYIIQTWIPDTSDVPQQLLEKGYRIIMSTKNAWYFAQNFGRRLIFFDRPYQPKFFLFYSLCLL
jgi:hexosaminidase